MLIIIDLPKLKSIKLGFGALQGVEYGASSASGLIYDDCSLTMKSDIDMNELRNRSSMSNIHHFYGKKFHLSYFSNSI